MTKAQPLTAVNCYYLPAAAESAQATSGMEAINWRVYCCLRFMTTQMSLLRQFTPVHYQDAIANEFHHAQIMGNERR